MQSGGFQPSKKEYEGFGIFWSLAVIVSLAEAEKCHVEVTRRMITSQMNGDVYSFTM